MSEKHFKIGCAALNQTPIDWDNNQQNILSAIDKARKEGIDMLCLPELCITAYGCEDLFLSEWLYETAFQKLSEIIPFTDNIAVNIGLPISFENKNYNTIAFIHNKQLIGFYAKQHLANDGVHYEKRWFSPWQANRVESITFNNTTYPIGDIVFPIPETDHIVGVEICEDAWQNPRPAAKHVAKGATIIINPSASHFAFGKTHLRNELVRSSSEKYNCIYLYANLLGNEAGKMIYDGEILIADKGKVVLRSELLSFENVVLKSILIDQNSNDLAPILSKENEFHSAISLALFDYLRKSRSKCYVLSLSGGADSSVCAVMVAQMIKKGIDILGIKPFLAKIHRTDLIDRLSDNQNENITFITSQLLFTAYQGTKNSSQNTFDAAESLANSLGATFYHWKIDDEVNSYQAKLEVAMNTSFTWETHDIALQNIQARSRSPIIWMLTNLTNGLLLTTSNRSEGDVGYTTMDGDTSGSIAPISGVDKSFIRHWLRWAETELAYTGLSKVNQLAPTAELRPGENKQTDEDDLMPYDTMLAIEQQAIWKYKSPKEVFEILRQTSSHNEEELKIYIRKFYTLWSRNQWKRERLAPGFHLDDFSVDPRSWCRFPILSGGYAKELEELNINRKDE